nr:hypothetical protein [Tanacetum cinerariifolium]
GWRLILPKYIRCWVKNH